MRFIVINNLKEHKKLSEEIYFRLSIALPLVIAVILFVGILLCESLGEQLNVIWETYKIPVTIASLSIPLAAWAIANHRSVQTMHGLKLQSHKRLYEMFYEQQNHFEKVMGRRIENAKFKYIEKDDLPVIFSELYEFNVLHQKGEVSLKSSANEEINRFLTKTGEIIFEFYCQFTEEREKKTEQHIVLDGYIEQLLRFLQRNLHQLSDDIGVRFIELSNASLEVFVNAYSEVLQLSYYMGDDFKAVWDKLEIDERSEDEDVLNTFSAVEKIIRDYSTKGGDATYKNFQEAIHVRQVIKFSQATKLQNLVREIYGELISGIKLHFNLKIMMEEGAAYDKYSIVGEVGGSSLDLWFEETTEMEGTLFLSCNLNKDNYSFDVNVKILDEFASDESGQKRHKYEVGKDLGKEFKSLCFSYLKQISS